MTDKKNDRWFRIAGFPRICRQRTDARRNCASRSVYYRQPDNADVVVIIPALYCTAKAEAVEAIKHAIACKHKGTIKKLSSQAALRKGWNGVV